MPKLPCNRENTGRIPISKIEKKKNFQAVMLIALSIVSAIVGFVLSIVMARVLGPDGFQKYIVAVAAVSLLGSFCEFGTGKFALRVLPQYAAEGQWSLASGYWRFSIGLILALSLATMFVVVFWEYAHDGDYGDHLVGLAILFLPTSVLLAVISEFVIANRAAIRGTLITKLLCPALTLLFVLGCYKVLGSVDPQVAIGCYGVSGICALLVGVVLFASTSPKQSLREKPEWSTRSWVAHCAWYFVLAFVMSWLFEVSVIVLEIAQVDDLETARFAAAAKTGCFILLVAKSTNKFYSPELSAIMTYQDWEKGLVLRRSRFLLIGSQCSVFLLVMILFGKSVLRWFGPEYEAASQCLIFIAIGTTISTLFSMSPEYLKFSEHQKSVLAIQIAGGAILVVLTWILGVNYGANGAGAALGLVLSCMSIIFFLLANRQIRTILNESPSQ